MKKAFENRLKKLINKHRVISFDIFDTLIKRNCINPIDIFEIVEMEYNKTNKKKIHNFKNERICAEKNARLQSTSEDITIYEIYDKLPYNLEIKDRLFKIEIRVEKKFCQRNNNMYDIYNYCKKMNKQIICISDMYLPKNVLSDILKSNGYDIDYLYVSSEIKKVKSSGNLFKYVLEDKRLLNKDVLHIGDSWRSDYFGAIKNGIRAYHIKKNYNNMSFIKINRENISSINSNIILSYINNNILSTSTYFYRMGYEIFGPVCLEMSYWINNNVNNSNIDNLLFCARDMKTVYEVYKMYFSDDSHKAHYFYVSRKSTYLPYLYVDNSFENFMKFFPLTVKKISIGEILELYNLKLKNEKVILKEYGFSSEEKYHTDYLIKSDNFRKLYEKEIKQIIKTDGKMQYDNLNKYLKSLSVGKNTALIDLGWRGNTQKILRDITFENIKGFYLGLDNQVNKFNKNDYYAYLFDKRNNIYFNEIMAIRTFIELFFSALHGSTLYYTSDDKKPFVLDKGANENNDAIMQIHQGALDFCKFFCIYKDYLFYDDDKLFIDDLINIGINPTYKQSKLFGEIYTENLEKRKIASPKSVLRYVFHPKKVKEDFFSSEWKIGFMKRLFIIRLPYYKVYEFLWKKKYNRNG